MVIGPRKILIVYESRTGFTKTYAQWLAEELEAEAVPLKSVKDTRIDGFDLVICGGGVCGNEINGMAKFKKLRRRNPAKHFVFFATGLRPATQSTVEAVKEYNFSANENADFFYLQSGLNYRKLDSNQKMLLVVFKAMLKRRQYISEEDRQLLRLMKSSVDLSDRSLLEPLVEYVGESYSAAV